MNTNTNKIFEKLSKIKEVKKGVNKSVNLSLIDDLSQDAEFFDEQIALAVSYTDGRFDELISEIEDFQNKIKKEVDNLLINTSISSIVDMAETYKPLLQKLESSANELGVNPSELYSDYEWLNGNVMNATQISQDFYQQYKDLVELAGFLTDFSK
jgi:hypothetical protein